jgi:hypothetical protein
LAIARSVVQPSFGAQPENGHVRDDYSDTLLGTIDGRVYRRGLSGRASLDDVKDHMADFKSYWNVDVTPAGWYPKGGSAG